MSHAAGKLDTPGNSPRILVVDDDRRVRELLEVALSAHGFTVITAADGDEAVKRAMSERPDLVVLDVRLPKRSGLDVCEILRSDPEDPTVPIVLVSAAAETDARLQAFTRGADDYLAKPFSPKELIARIKRLLARAAETRTARTRAVELERELHRSRDEARRASGDSRREQRLRETSASLGRELHGTLDFDALAERLLGTARTRLGMGVAALLAREDSTGSLLPAAIQGDGPERIAGLQVRANGELAAILRGLGRPVLRSELERIPEVRAEIEGFVRARLTLIVPLLSRDGLVGLLLLDERPDGTPIPESESQVIGGLAEIAAIALENALTLRMQSSRLLDLAVTGLPREAASVALHAEAAALADHAARTLRLAPRSVDLVGRALLYGARGLEAAAREELDRWSACDPSGRIHDLVQMFQRVADGAAGREHETPDQRRALELMGLGLDYLAARMLGADSEEAIAYAAARSAPGGEQDTLEALRGAARELTSRAA